MARECSARSHFDVTWLKKTRLEVTWRPTGWRKIGSNSLRGHLPRANSARSRFVITWLGKLRLEVIRLQPTWLEKTVRGNHSTKLFKEAVTAPLSSALLNSDSSKTRMDILGYTYAHMCVRICHTADTYIYIIRIIWSLFLSLIHI